MLTLDEYFDLPEQPFIDFEMLDGKLVEMEKPGFEYNAIMGRCAYVLIPLCRDLFPSLALSGKTDFVLSERNVHAPEVVLLDQRTLGTAERYRDALRCAGVGRAPSPAGRRGAARRG